MSAATKSSLGVTSQGLSVFWDVKLSAGQTYRDVLSKELAESKCVVVAWSKQSVNSRWVIDEAERGLELERLVPITIDETLPPLGFRQIHAGRLVGWRGDISDPQFIALVSSILDCTDKVGVPHVSQPAVSQRKARTDVFKYLDAPFRFFLLLLANVFSFCFLGALFSFAYSGLGLWQAAAMALAIVTVLTGIQSATDNSKGLARWSIETDLEWLTVNTVILAAAWCLALWAQNVSLVALATFCLIYFPVNYLSNYIARTKLQQSRLG
jgi:TIR domain